VEVGLWVFVVALGVVWVLCALDNGRTAWRQIICGEDDGRPFSPLIGGLVGGIAVAVAPVGGLAERLPWVIVPAVLDFGSLPYIGLCLVGPAWANTRLRSLAYRRDVVARNRFGQSPLHASALLNLPDRCRELIALGADVLARDRWGQTPLDRATIALSDEAARVIAAAAGVEYRPLPRKQAEPFGAPDTGRNID
jgi:hypothetical protein